MTDDKPPPAEGIYSKGARRSIVVRRAVVQLDLKSFEGVAAVSNLDVGAPIGRFGFQVHVGAGEKDVDIDLFLSGEFLRPEAQLLPIDGVPSEEFDGYVYVRLGALLETDPDRHLSRALRQDAAP